MSLRYFNVAGATERNGEDHDPETHLIPNVLAAAAGTGRRSRSSATTTRRPTARCIRDYIDVADLADAHLLALEATAPGDARTDEPLVCNLGQRRRVQRPRGDRGGRARSSGGRSRTRSARGGPGDPPVLVADDRPGGGGARLAAARSTLEEMIGSAWAWRQAQPGGYARLSGRPSAARAARSPGRGAPAARLAVGDLAGARPEVA